MQRASRKPKSSSTEDLVEDRLALRLILTEIARTIARLAILPLQWVAARFQLGSLSRKRLTVWTAILFVIATALAIFQYALPYTWHQPYAILRAQWWLRPMEWNVDAGLPQINGNINAVLNTPDGACLWIAGDAGLLAFSADRGKNWTQLTYGPVTQEFRAPADAQPCGATKAGTPATSRLSLVPPLYGASPQSTVPQQAQQSTAQTAPVQTQEAPSASKSGSTKSPAPNASPRGFTNAESSSSSTTNAALDVFPKVVDFGSAYDSSKYAPARASVHVKNLDQKSVSLSRVTLSPSIFQIDRAQKDSCSDQLLGPGTECIVPLTFAPTSIGKFQGQLQFGSSNSAQPWVVGLLGIGEDSPPTAASPANTPSNNTAVAAPQGTAAKPYTRSSELSLKPPDLWGIADSRTALGEIYTSGADVYRPQDSGLIWRRQPPSHSETSLTLDAADKQLIFENDLGSYRLKSVTGRCWRAVLDAVQWNSTSGDFFVFTYNSRGTTEMAELRPSKPNGDITSLSFAGFAGNVPGWAINYVTTASPNSQAPNDAVTTQVLHTTDDAQTWTVLKSFEGEVLKSVHFRSDGKTGWVAGDNGVLLSTVDGGASWRPLTSAAGSLLRLGKWTAPKTSEQYVRFVPPWYLLALLICGVLATPLLFPVDVAEGADKTPPQLDKEEAQQKTTTAGPREADASTIGNQAIADKPLEPGDPDALGLSTIAAGLAFFLRNEKTKPPLAIAINGRG